MPRARADSGKRKRKRERRWFQKATQLAVQARTKQQGKMQDTIRLSRDGTWTEDSPFDDVACGGKNGPENGVGVYVFPFIVYCCTI